MIKNDRKATSFKNYIWSIVIGQVDSDATSLNCIKSLENYFTNDWYKYWLCFCVIFQFWKLLGLVSIRQQQSGGKFAIVETKFRHCKNVATKATTMILLFLSMIVGYSAVLQDLNFNPNNFGMTPNFQEDLESCHVNDDPFSMVDPGRNTESYSQSDYLIHTGQ